MTESSKPLENIQAPAYYQEKSTTPLSLDEMRKRYNNGDFMVSVLPLNLGIGARLLWFGFEFTNRQFTDLSKRLSVKTSWLDVLKRLKIRYEDLAPKMNV